MLEISGDERLTWLHTISNQWSSPDLPDRRSAENLSLDLTGRIVDHFVLTDIDEVTWVTPRDRADRAGRLPTKMVFGPKLSRWRARTCAC